MKVLRHPIVLMYLVLIMLGVVALIFMRTVFGVFDRESTLRIPKPSNTEYTQWELPKGAKARLGKGAINDIKFSPDGARFAVATTIGVWMYDAKTGAELSLFSGDRYEFKGIAFSYDGSILSGVTSDGEISRWDAETGELHSYLINETVKRLFKVTYLYKVYYSKDSTRLASVNIHYRENEKVHVWNLDEGMPPTITNIEVGEDEGISSTIALSPDNRFLATSKEEKGERFPIHVWNTDTGERQFTLERKEQRSSRAIEFSPDGKTLASCGFDTITLWDIDTKTPRANFKTEFSLLALAFSPNGKLLASGDDDGMVNLWNATVKQEGLAGKISQNLSNLKLRKHREEIVALAFSPDGKMLLSGSKDGTIRAWDTTTGQQQYICSGHVGSVTDIAVTAEGNTLISLNSDAYMSADRLIKWDINTRHPFSSTFFNFKSPQTISQNASMFVVRKSGNGRKIQLWNTTKVRLRYELNGHEFASDWWGLVNAFSPDGKMVAVTSSAHPIGSIHLWDIANPSKSLLGRIFNPKSIQPTYTFEGNQHRVIALAFSPDGKILASSGDCPDINLWSTESGEKLFTLTGDQSYFDNLAFSPGGNMLASARHLSVYLWDLTSRRLLRKIKTHIRVQELLFSPDGRTLVSGRRSGSIQLLDSYSGQVHSTHTGHSEGIESKQIIKLLFLDDGKTLVSACQDGTILLWDWEKITKRR